MRKFSWLLGAVLATSVLAGSITLYKFGAFAELTEQDNDGGPPDGDYWAVRAGVTSTVGKIDPLGLVKAAKQERTMAVATPAGKRTYSQSIAHSMNSPLTLDPDHFINLGPQPENNTQQSFNHVSGRVNWIAVDPTQTQPDNIVAFIGTDGGGIWKTVNCCSPNTTWQVKTDFPEISSMSISDVTIDPSDHNVIYGATGDLNYGSFSFGSAGILKSTDNGETWELLGADVFTPYYAPAAGSFPQYQAVGKVRVDPNNSNNVIAGTKTGLYFSYDAGNTWSGPCYTNPFATGDSPQRQDITGLLPIDNGDGTTRLYAAVGTRGIPTPVQPDLGNQGANGVYRMDEMPTSGCPDLTSWTLLNSGWPSGTGDGVAADTLLGRIEIAYAPSNPYRMYAEAQDTGTRAVNSIYRSDDGGDHWTLTTGPVSTMGCEGNSNNGGAQMWYDAGLTVDPNNPDRVFMSTIDLTVSQNGAASFFDVTCGYGNHSTTGNVGQAVHVDNHARAYVGNDSTQMLVGSDGGVYYTNNADTSVTASNIKNNMNFIAMNDSISTIEFYFGDITSNFATSATPAIGAGAQDNGCSLANFAGTPTGPVLWNSNCSGDGTVTKIEPIFNQIWFNSSQNGSLGRNTTGGTGSFSNASANFGGTWGGDPVASIFGMSYDIYKWGNTSVVGSGCDAVNGCNHMIAGTTRLWETVQSTAAGSIRATWKARTLNLTKNDLLFPNGDLRSYINYVAYSFTDPGTAIVATNDGNVQIVFGLGGTATANCVTPGSDPNCATAVDVTGGNAVLPNRPIQGVRFDPTTNLVAYAAVGGFNGNIAQQQIPPPPGTPPAIPGHVFRVTCTALCASFTWEDKTGNLPDIPAQQVMPNPNLPQQVFVGTDWGLYYTDNINASPPVWHRFEGLPHVMIWELVVDRGFTTMAAFTRARGAWVWPLPQSQLGVADVAISATGPATANAGDTITYTITVTNNNPSQASNVAVTDTVIPGGLTFVSNSGDCTTGFPCDFATLDVGETKTITSTFKVNADDPPGTITNQFVATSAGADPDMSNNVADVDTLVSVAADVGVSQTGPSGVDAGADATFVITVTNNGPSTATDVVVSDATLPASVTFVSNTGDCVTAFPCTFASIAPGDSRTINATFSVPADTPDGSTLTNTVSVTSTSNDGNSVNDSSSLDVPISASADVSITFTAPTIVDPGASFVYTTTITNNGSSTATNVAVSSTLPSGVGFVSNSGDCTSAFPCTFPSIDPGATETISTTVCVPSNYSGDNPFTVSTAVASTTTDPDTTNNAYSFNASINTDVLFANGFETCP